MIPWTLAAAILHRSVSIGVDVSSTALAAVQRAACYCTRRACVEFARELDDCWVAEGARGR